MTAVNAGARLDRLPISKFHYRLLGLIAGGMFLDAFEIYLMGGVLGALVAIGWSTPAMNANFISVTFAGMVGGAWFAGITGDRFGRRFAYQINLLVFGLSSLAGALAPSMNWLIAARFVMGLGLGAEIVVGYATISEFVPPASRGRWGAGLAVITNSALFLSSMVGRIVIPNFGWRWMFVIVGVGALAVWVLRRNMPESPRWLESRGRLAEAEAVMTAIEAEASGGKKLPAPVIVPEPPHQKLTLMALFAPGMALRTTIASVMMVAMNTATYGFLAFLPTFMVKQGLSVVTSLNYVTLMSFGGPVGALIGFWLSDRLGRKPCVLIFSAAVIVCGAVYPAMTDPAFVTLVGFLLVTAVYVLIAIGFGLYVPELFPTEIRMRGCGFANSIGRLATIGTPQLVIPLFAMAGITGVLSMVGGLVLVQAVLVALFGIETRQKSLEALTPWAEDSAAARPQAAAAPVR